MPLILASVDAFIVTTIAVVAPLAVFIRRPRYLQETSYRQLFNAIVILHTIYILYVITLLWPPNIFSRLNIPLTMPSDSIRSLLLTKATAIADEFEIATLPKPLDTLLTRLSSFEMRTLYVRFGQMVMQDCEYCRNFDEYALYALPAPLMEYTRECFLIGITTITGSHRERWRTYAIAALVSAAVVEGYLVAVANVRVPRSGLGVYMLHDKLWLFRQLIFLILPIIVHCLPPSPPPPNVMNELVATWGNLNSMSTRLSALRYARGAIMRDQSLSQAALDWWKHQKKFGDWAKEDLNVQRTAGKLGLGFVDADDGTEPKLRSRAKLASIALTQSFNAPGAK